MAVFFRSDCSGCGMGVERTPIVARMRIAESPTMASWRLKGRMPWTWQIACEGAAFGCKQRF
jgi:hypothetical protein